MLPDKDRLFKDFQLTQEENELLEEQLKPNNRDNAIRSHYTIMSTIYSAKKLEKAINEMIKSNENLSISNKRYVVTMTILTIVLVIIGIFQML